MNNRDFNNDQNNGDSDFCHNGAGPADVGAHLHHVGVDDVLLGHQEVGHLLLVQHGGQVELGQVLPQEAVHRRHVLPGHRPQPWGLGGLAGVGG